MYVTYADLIQLLIFFVAFVGFFYKIFKETRKYPPIPAIVDGCL